MPLQTSCHHLLQQLPQSALPEVSDRGPGTLDRGTSKNFSQRHVHVVFTLPPPLAPLALQNKKVIYDLCSASAETLLEVARDRNTSAQIGFFTVLHTWNQKLGLHPHVHCVIPAGGLSPDHTHWVKSRDRFFLPIHVLRRVFRASLLQLRQAFRDHQLVFHGNLTLLAQPSTSPLVTAAVQKRLGGLFKPPSVA
jgi:hypothetical protein